MYSLGSMDLENEVVMWYVKYLVVHNSIMEEGWGAPPERTAKKKLGRPPRENNFDFGVATNVTSL